jgi:BASS family bile acid:Na+ symporter
MWFEMTMAQLIILVLQASVVGVVFALGLGAAPGDLAGLFRRPGLLARSLVSMFLVMLVVAVVAVKVAGLRHPVEVVIVALALAPIPPLLPKKQVKAGGETSFIYGLIVAASLFAIVWIPLALGLLSRVVGHDLSAPLGNIVGIVVVMILAPLAAGALISRYAPGLASRIQAPINRLAMLILLAGLALIYAKAWPAMMAEIGDGTLAALVGFAVVGLVSGHLLGGPRSEDRSVLAIATSTRHPGIALAIATLNAPAEKAVIAVILLYLLVSAIVALPYVAWRRRAGAMVPLEA